MRTHRVILAASVLLAALIPASAFSQVESTPIPAPAKPNFASQQFLIGTWSCSTMSARRPSAYLTTVTYSMDPSGWWINSTSVTAPMKWFPMKSTQWDKITWDADTHRWADVSYGTPNGYDLTVSRGWSGSRETWHDLGFAPTSDISGQSDTVMTKVSSTKIVGTSTFTEAKTGRVVSVRTTCTKHSAMM